MSVHGCTCPECQADRVGNSDPFRGMEKWEYDEAAWKAMGKAAMVAISDFIRALWRGDQPDESYRGYDDEGIYVGPYSWGCMEVDFLGEVRPTFVYRVKGSPRTWICTTIQRLPDFAVADKDGRVTFQPREIGDLEGVPEREITVIDRSKLIELAEKHLFAHFEQYAKRHQMRDGRREQRSWARGQADAFIDSMRRGTGRTRAWMPGGFTYPIELNAATERVIVPEATVSS